MQRTVLNKYKQVAIFVIVILVLFLNSCSSGTQKKAAKADQTGFEKKVTIETFKSGQGWGYEIKIDGKTKIYQPNIPAVQGNLTFDSETDAHRVAELVVEKMKSQSLPSISIKELDSLQIKY